MITLFIRLPEGITSHIWTPDQPYPQDVVWIDIESASPEEEAAFQMASGVDLPRQEEDWKNGMFNRMQKLNNVSHMTAAVIHKNETFAPETRSITFVLTESILVTIRDIYPTSFKNFSRRLMEHPHDFSSSPEILGGLLEDMILRIAHNSEQVMTRLDEISHQIFSLDSQTGEKPKFGATTPLKKTLQRVGVSADLNSKISESLHSMARLLAFFREDQDDNHYLARKLDMLISDVRELLQHTDSVSNKISFLMDTTLGMIDVEMSDVMKVLSIISAIIMPPTLVGSIYGMNFHYMPELSHVWGYPLALLIMVFCAGGPYVFFRKKGWV